ncbi:hypothetical protein NYR75_02790 [Actinobacillus equuli subsp. haemolyticus]|uniref:Uncharacterized protein n=1 Tax=Actinobacillus equuli subsp. equuli TaxID=202947 RepID=A0A9X4G3U3_ACTEU|nr:hypothetical protein [Actinobacillus equuli]MDE8034623.1 hypothetical protein [Actinobacillus equuli subsp. equuli]MDG4948741.1 hypothetical protein [Actinobacillus equuli subsp. haemolyticus]WGE63768.1 hypothetical protein NYR75_02790 [Actinobacillus equuli subsp. haemolyticus]
MSKQLHYQHKSRWKRFKNMNKRRVNQFLLEKRVQNLESKLADEVELAKLNSEQIEDLITELERKVEFVIRQNKQLREQLLKPKKPKKKTQKESLFGLFKELLCGK